METLNNDPERTHEQEVIERLTSFIVDKVSPEKIILFGSRARGDHKVDSDYDILILTKGEISNFEVTRKIRRELFHTDLTLDIDFLAVDIDRYEKLKTTVGYIYKTIEREGRILYAK
jgi:predicted nucleotidyltransferase